MTITSKVYSLPNFPISGQVFYVPGAAYEGGFTSGGSRLVSPEPGGFGMLQIQPANQADEFTFPLSSWLMSKGNGAVLRLRLAPTPQVCGAELMRNTAQPGGVPWNGNILWSNGLPWSGGYTASYAAAALRGTNVVKIDMSDNGRILKIGHIIGHKFSTYLIDEIEYDDANMATLTVMPPLRTEVNAGDSVLFRPFFTGSIVNQSEIVQSYEAEMNGNIQLPKLTLAEAILP